jgi:hypothetical protein
LAANETLNRRGTYLPVLPDDWTYTVQAMDGDGHHVRIDRAVDGNWVIAFTKDGETRVTHAVSLSEALSFLSKGVRAIVKAERDEAEARKARKDVLSLLGEPMPGGDA